mgnify:FL=1
MRRCVESKFFIAVLRGGASGASRNTGEILPCALGVAISPIPMIAAILMLLFAVRQWKSRPTGDAEPALPKWLSAIDTMTAGRGLLLAPVSTRRICSWVPLPVIGYLVASARIAGPLESLRTWLVHNNATVMSVLLLVIGVVMIGKGTGSF